MLHRSVFLPVLLLATPVWAGEIRCEGAFAADSSAQRLEETYGKENVVTGEVPGPEGSTYIASTVFPNDPDKQMVFGWWDEDNRRDLASVDLPAGDSIAGVKAGMTVGEVEALNGEPFTMTGFWWDYGGRTFFQSGNLASIEGGCNVLLTFTPTADPEGTDTEAVSGEVDVPSGEPLLETLKVEVMTVTIGYPYPGAEEDEMEGAEMEEDTRG